MEKPKEIPRTKRQQDAAELIQAAEQAEQVWVAVDNALRNPKYDFRTVAGIVRETKLSKSEVEKALEDNAFLVRVAPSTDKKGNVLYTLKSRPKKLRETVSEIISIVSASTSTATTK